MTQPQQPMLEPQGLPYAEPDTPRGRRFRFPSWSGALLALLILVVATAIKEPKFLQLANILNILEQNATVGMIAIGMTLIITLGGIDLSVGSLVALAGGLGIWTLNTVTTAMRDVPQQPEFASTVVIAGVVTISIGLLAGLFNGVLITKGRIAPFIATLAGLLIFRSTAMWIARGGQFFSDGSELFANLGNGFDLPGTNISRNPRRIVPLEFPYAILVWIAVAILAMVLLNRMRLGRYIIAIGNNERAARYSAVAVDRVKIITYTLLGGITGVAALMNAANYTSVNSANTGILLELDAIAAVVIGGTRMEGGAGSIVGTILGVLLLGVIRNMMVLLGIDTYAQGVVTGGIIIAAVLLQRAGTQRA